MHGLHNRPHPSNRACGSTDILRRRSCLLRQLKREPIARPLTLLESCLAPAISPDKGLDHAMPQPRPPPQAGRAARREPGRGGGKREGGGKIISLYGRRVSTPSCSSLGAVGYDRPAFLYSNPVPGVTRPVCKPRHPSPSVGRPPPSSPSCGESPADSLFSLSYISSVGRLRS